MENLDQYRISPDKLKRVCDCEQELNFCTSSMEVPKLDGVIGQERAVRSMQFGLAMDAQGYNIFVAGQPGTGKTTYVNASVTEAAANGPLPNDWCYVNNFSDSGNPIIIALPAGQGRIFQKDMDEMITEFQSSIPKAFESSDFEQQKNTLLETFQKFMQERFEAFQAEATKVSFQFKPKPSKFLIMPVKNDKPISNEEFENLPPEERKVIEETGHNLEKKLDDILREGKIVEIQTNEKIIELEKQITLAATVPSITKLKEKYGQFKKLLKYLDDVLKDIEENHDLFLETTEESETPSQANILQADDEDDFTRYQVNLFVNHEKATGSPVIVEPSPNYYNLFGKIEYNNQMMSVSTDFTMVKAGAIHRANGGYLILQAKDVLTEPFVWAQPETDTQIPRG